MLIRSGKVLVEKRTLLKKTDPGLITIPGGHCEIGEPLHQALVRELDEELGVAALEQKFICTLLHKAEEVQRVHYYAIPSWEGELLPNEAEYLIWIPLTDISQVDLAVDRMAIGEYLRMLS